MNDPKPPVDRQSLESRLQAVEQTHLLDFWDELHADQRRQLGAQVESIDYRRVQKLTTFGHDEQDWRELAAKAESPAAYRLGDQAARFSIAEARDAAAELLSAGKLGAMIVAGGQGTRLGFPHPKGMFKVGPVSQRSLLQIHIEQLLAVSKKYGARVPLYLMTSPATHGETLEFLEAHDRFGLAVEDLHPFCQGVMPAVDAAGKLLLAEKDSIFLSPDGHGGMLDAFQRSGCLEHAQQQGLEQLFYFQVDNPLVRIADRELVGYHLLSDSEMSTQVVAKKSPLDKVGNVVSVDGRLLVIEYSDLPTEAAEIRSADGELKFWAGSIAVHVFQLDFLRRAAASDDSLPFHRAQKKVSYIDRHGQRIEPSGPNATKFERFIFDLMPMARNAIVVEADEAEVFAPLKNASGASKDTPESTRAAIVARAKRWLRTAGVGVAEGCRVEISPFLAVEAEELMGRVSALTRIEQHTYLS